MFTETDERKIYKLINIVEIHLIFTVNKSEFVKICNFNNETTNFSLLF